MRPCECAAAAWGAGRVSVKSLVNLWKSIQIGFDFTFFDNTSSKQTGKNNSLKIFEQPEATEK